MITARLLSVRRGSGRKGRWTHARVLGVQSILKIQSSYKGPLVRKAHFHFSCEQMSPVVVFQKVLTRKQRYSGHS